MAFSSLSQSARARILLELKGAAKYVADTQRAAMATQELAFATKEQGIASTRATRATFLHAQAIYTLRRYAFFGTLALVGIGAAAIKMGFDFDLAMQTTTVSMSRFVGGMANARKEANFLYVLAAKTPFEFTDLSLAARRLLPAFNGNLQQTNDTLKDIGNALAGFGITSASALQRASLALTHMMVIGRLTGQTLFQLNRDNIPMQKALEEAYGATGLQIKQAVSQGAISAQDAMEAFHRYINNPAHGFHDAAKRLGLSTLQGNFTTFHDLVAQAFGSAEMGGFTKLVDHFKTINNYLIDLVQNGHKLTLTDLVTAIDKSFSPATHRITHLFITLKTAMMDVWHSIQFGMSVIEAILGPITSLTGLFGGASDSAKNLGHFLALLIDMLIIEKAVTFGAALAIDAYKISTWAVIGMTKAWTAATKALVFWQTLETYQIETYTTKYGDKFNRQVLLHQGRMANFARTIKLRVIPAIATWVGVQWAAVSALLATEVTILGITLALFWWVAIFALIAYGLVVLYFKWKPFRDIVNETAGFLWKNWKYWGLLLGIAVYATVMIVQHWSQIKDAISYAIDKLIQFYNWLVKIATFGTGGKGGFGTHLRHFALDAVRANFPFVPPAFAGGGTMNQSGLALVGERGPELLHLPRGSQVTPMQSPQPAFASLTGGSGGGDNQPIVVQLVLRDRVVEQVMVDIMEKRRARR